MDLSVLFDFVRWASTKHWADINLMPLSEDMQRALLDSDEADYWACALRNAYAIRDLAEEIVAAPSTPLNVERKVQLILSVQDLDFHMRLTSEADRDVLWTLAEVTPFPEVIEVLLASPDTTILWNLANNLYTSKDQLRRISHNPAPEVHVWLTTNEKTLTGLDASWGASFLARRHAQVFDGLAGSMDVYEARTLAESWRGDMKSLLEALALTRR